MQEKQRYIVHTRWGVFSLSEECYQDYLAGKLWISWDPDKKRRETQISDSEGGRILNVSKEALALREEAATIGVVETIAAHGFREQAVFPYLKRMQDVSIEELCLSTRAGNGLMRAGLNTLGKLHDRLQSEAGLITIRNLGAKSAKEIRECFITGCYERLSNNEKAMFWQEELDNRGNSEVPDAVS